ncbi:hypothetical protein ACVMB0_002791 [Bradyrhizobium sp. USDA 4451]
MPPRATRQQRIAWHVAHAKVCACRPVPDSVRLEVEALLNSRRRPLSAAAKNQEREPKLRKQPHAK